MKNRMPTPFSRRLRLGAGLVAVCLAAAACGGGGNQTSNGETEFADGDVVRIVLGSSAGGGFDTQARLLAPYFDEALDEATGADVNVVVENMPGAGHQIATNHIYTSDPDDNAFLFSSAQLLVTNDIVRDAEYDITKMTPLGSAGRSSRGFLVPADLKLPEPTIEDLVKYSQDNNVRLSHPDLDADVALLGVLLEEAGLEFGADPIVVGNTSEQVASLLRGETEAAMTTAFSLKEAAEQNEGELTFLGTLACEADPLLPEAETIVEQGLPGAETICATVGYDDRVFLGPPEMPSETADLISGALETATGDPGYAEKAESASLVNEWFPPEDLAETMDTLVTTYKKYESQLGM